MSKMLSKIDEVLSRISMYRFMLYYLIGLLIMAAVLSFFNVFQFSFFDLTISTGIVIFLTYISNLVLARVFNVSANKESYLITALILLLIITPGTSLNNLVFLGIAAILAIASKYLLVIRRRHVFNPVAIAVVLTGFLMGQYASWWVGTTAMLPFVILGGILMVRKMNRFLEVNIFMLFTIAILIANYALRGFAIAEVSHVVYLAIVQSAFFFFTFVMFTEPITSPSTRNGQIFFAIVTSILYTTVQVKPFGVVLAPEMALAFANIFAFIFYPRFRYPLPIKSRRKIAKDSWEFTFERPKNFKYLPGQYMEWTLPHESVDSRGIRRYFSIASAPAENNLAIAVRYYNPPSTFKDKLLKMGANDKIIASELGGNFTLPKNKNKKLTFIAGGIGIVPFRSIIKDMVTRGVKRDVTLFYANKTIEDIAYTDEFEEAEKIGLKTIYVLSDPPENWPGHSGYLDIETIKNGVPDFMERTFYISGPPKMVNAYKDVLKKMGVRRGSIITDYFDGY